MLTLKRKRATLAMSRTSPELSVFVTELSTPGYLESLAFCLSTCTVRTVSTVETVIISLRQAKPGLRTE
jgi:hypothetical protein